MADMPAWGATGSGTATAEETMTNAVSNLAPLAPTWNGPLQNSASYMAPVAAKSTDPSGLGGLMNKIESIGKESAHLAEGVGSWALHQGEQAGDVLLAF